MKALRLKETATQYTTKRNRYGDMQLTQTGRIQCLFRSISLLNRNANFREEVQVQGIFWFAPDSGVSQGDVLGYNGLLYRMERVTNAKTLLTRNAPHFVKCEASLYRAIS